MRNSRRVKKTSVSNVSARFRADQGVHVITQIAVILGLTKVETGHLFGITRQAVDRWYKNGVPMNRISEVESVADIARALQARFIPERIPQLVRKPLPGLNERSVLETIRDGRYPTVLNMLDRAFSYVPDNDS